MAAGKKPAEKEGIQKKEARDAEGRNAGRTKLTLSVSSDLGFSLKEIANNLVYNLGLY